MNPLSPQVQQAFAQIESTLTALQQAVTQLKRAAMTEGAMHPFGRRVEPFTASTPNDGLHHWGGQGPRPGSFGNSGSFVNPNHRPGWGGPGNHGYAPPSSGQLSYYQAVVNHIYSVFGINALQTSRGYYTLQTDLDGAKVLEFLQADAKNSLVTGTKISDDLWSVRFTPKSTPVALQTTTFVEFAFKLVPASIEKRLDHDLAAEKARDAGICNNLKNRVSAHIRKTFGADNVTQDGDDYYTIKAFNGNIELVGDYLNTPDFVNLFVLEGNPNTLGFFPFRVSNIIRIWIKLVILVKPTVTSETLLFSRRWAEAIHFWLRDSLPNLGLCVVEDMLMNGHEAYRFSFLNTLVTINNQEGGNLQVDNLADKISGLISRRGFNVAVFQKLTVAENRLVFLLRHDNNVDQLQVDIDIRKGGQQDYRYGRDLSAMMTSHLSVTEDGIGLNQNALEEIFEHKTLKAWRDEVIKQFSHILSSDGQGVEYKVTGTLEPKDYHPIYHCFVNFTITVNQNEGLTTLGQDVANSLSQVLVEQGITDRLVAYHGFLIDRHTYRITNNSGTCSLVVALFVKVLGDTAESAAFDQFKAMVDGSVPIHHRRDRQSAPQKPIGEDAILIKDFMDTMARFTQRLGAGAELFYNDVGVSILKDPSNTAGWTNEKFQQVIVKMWEHTRDTFEQSEQASRQRLSYTSLYIAGPWQFELSLGIHGKLFKVNIKADPLMVYGSQPTVVQMTTEDKLHATMQEMVDAAPKQTEAVAAGVQKTPETFEDPIKTKPAPKRKKPAARKAATRTATKPTTLTVKQKK